jgi:hypothetical protein
MPGILDRDIEETESFPSSGLYPYYVDAASGERVSPADVGRKARGCWYSGGLSAVRSANADPGVTDLLIVHLRIVDHDIQS